MIIPIPPYIRREREEAAARERDFPWYVWFVVGMMFAMIVQSI
jgi:hypothetical protein